jgi:uncharacterized protein (TIGR00297 family)
VIAGLSRSLAGIALAAGVAGLAERRGSLSATGAVAAALVGSVAFAHSWAATRALLTFFLTSTLLSHLPHNVARRAPKRSATQVFANGGVATAAWVLSLAGAPNGLDRLAVGSLAAAAADTWATEIGQRWGGVPRLITSGDRVEPGESGGITIIGTAAALLGAMCVALATQPRAAAPVAIAGLTGSLVDSILGAALQARYRCMACDVRIEQSEHCGQVARIVSGNAWMTNDLVNAIASLASGAIYAGIIRQRP